jgi:hypothetical protein
MSKPDDFYVGYLPSAPKRTAEQVAAIVALIGAVSSVVALLLVAGQHEFATSQFEFGEYKSFAGVFREQPYPRLELGLGRSSLLVAPGKHGLVGVVRGMDGVSVELRGSHISRDGQNMIELLPGSVVVKGDPATRGPAEVVPVASSITMVGEIVDTKCYLGVMNPGEGKVHRDCAARCISGGVPPAFLARDASGRMRLFLLSRKDWLPMNKRDLSFVAEPVRITGVVVRFGDMFALRFDPVQLRRIPE